MLSLVVVFVLNITINIVFSHITAVSHHITVFFLLLSILPLFSVMPTIIFIYLCARRDGSDETEDSDAQAH